MSTQETTAFHDKFLPVMAAAVEAAGQVVAAGVAKGRYYHDTTSEVYGSHIAAVAGQIMKALVPNEPTQ